MGKQKRSKTKGGLHKLGLPCVWTEMNQIESSFSVFQF